MPAFVNGMVAVKYKRLKNLAVCFGYPALLSNGMDAVKTPNLMDGKNHKGHTKNKGISLEMLLLLLVLLFHYSTDLGNQGRLLNCCTVSKSQHAFP